MRMLGFGCALILLGASVPALGQVPVVPAGPAPAQEPAPPPPAPEPAPPPPAPPPPVSEEPPAAPPAEAPAPAPAPPPEPAPVVPPAPPAPSPVAEVEKPPEPKKADELPPFQRARSPLTLDVRLGFAWRPEGNSGFDDEDTLGSELGASLYFELWREIAAGVEIDRTTLGRGTAVTGLDSVSADYTVTSAMLGFRAYPKRSELFDVFVTLQLGAGVQSVSASGTENNGALVPASPYTCGAADQPAFQIGGGIGARFMLSSRWGLTARVGGTGRRLSGEMIDACARGLGTATTVGASLGIGYDFDLEPDGRH